MNNSIPYFEKATGGVILRLNAWLTSPSDVRLQLLHAQHRINDLLATHTGDLTTPVQIKRIRGIEPVSTNWSALQTIKHLQIINDEIYQIIQALKIKNAQLKKADIAAVKPPKAVTKKAIEEFNDSCVKLIGTSGVQGIITHLHPWFGKLSAHQWHYLSLMHMKLHEKQLREIIATTHRGYKPICSSS